MWTTSLCAEQKIHTNMDAPLCSWTVSLFLGDRMKKAPTVIWEPRVSCLLVCIHGLYLLEKRRQDSKKPNKHPSVRSVPQEVTVMFFSRHYICLFVCFVSKAPQSGDSVQMGTAVSVNGNISKAKMNYREILATESAQSIIVECFKWNSKKEILSE